MNAIDQQKGKKKSLKKNASYLERDDGGPVSHLPLYSWEDVLRLSPHICAKRVSSVQLCLSNTSLNLEMLENSLQSSVWQII